MVRMKNVSFLFRCTFVCQPQPLPVTMIMLSVLIIIIIYADYSFIALLFNRNNIWLFILLASFLTSELY